MLKDSSTVPRTGILALLSCVLRLESWVLSLERGLAAGKRMTRVVMYC
jgi:hypothetical protein